VIFILILIFWQEWSLILILNHFKNADFDFDFKSLHK